jgi:hypothetical protein
MKIKKNISLLLLVLFLAMSMLMAKNTDDTYYKRYNTMVIDTSQVEGATTGSFSENGVALPIIATYNPNIDEDFFVRSSNNERVGLYYDDNPITYNTEYYDITSVRQSEDFTLSYINNLDKSEKRYVDILYDKQFYSVDGQKHTGISIDLDYENIINDRKKIKLEDESSGESNYWINGNNNESFNYNSFRFKIKKGYHNASLLKFNFTWTPKSIDEINAYSSNYNNKVFTNGERVIAFVLIQIYVN